MPLPAKCNCSCLLGDEDGILTGPFIPLGHHYHTTLTNLFKAGLVKKTIKGTGPAVVFGSSTLTFSELDHMSSAIAIPLEKVVGTEFVVTNPEEEIIIGVCLPLSERIIPLIFAILKLGAALLPLDPTQPEHLLLAIIDKFRPVVVVTDDNGPILSKYDAKSFAEYSKLVSFEDMWIQLELPPEGDPQWENHTLSKQIQIIQPPIPTTPHHRPAVVVYSMGLAGNPRGVRIGHMAIINRCVWEWKAYPFKTDTLCALTTNIHTIDGLVQVFTALLKGCTMYLFKSNETYNMSALINTIHEKKINRLYFTSNTFVSFVRTCEKLGKESEEFRYLEFVCCTGDRIIPVEPARIFLSIFHSDVVLVTYYGGPEVCGNMLYKRIKNETDLNRKVVNDSLVLDTVMTNSVVYVLSNFLELTKDGCQGEICIAGDPIALGYVDMKEEETEQRFVKNPHDQRKNFTTLFRTGEYGRIQRKNGKRCMYVEGRRDTQIYVRGSPVIIEDIIDLLMSLDVVEVAEVYAYHPGSIDQYLVAFVQPPSEALLADTKTAEHIRGALAHMIPENLLPQIKVVEKMPRPTAPEDDWVSLNVQSNLLIRLYEEGLRSSFSSWSKVRLPSDKLPVFKLIAGAMYKFAGIPIELAAESLHLSFYDIGGTSLNTLSCLLYLNRRGCPLAVKDWVISLSLEDLVNIAIERMMTKNASEATNEGPTTKEENKTKKANVINTIEIRLLTQPLSKSKPKTQKTVSIVSLNSFFTSMSALKEFYEVKLASSSCKKDMIEIISQAYSTKGTLERYSLVRQEDYELFLNNYWDLIMDQQLCTIVTRITDKKIVACSLNQDFYTSYPELFNSKLKSISHLLEYQLELKGSVIHRLPHLRDSIMQVTWIGTDSTMSPAENVGVVTMLMQENIKLAKQEGYSSVFCLATNTFLKELCLDALSFSILEEFPARLFERKTGVHPFRVAPVTVSTSICWLIVGPLPSKTSSMNPSYIDALEGIPEESLKSLSLPKEFFTKKDSAEKRSNKKLQ